MLFQLKLSKEPAEQQAKKTINDWLEVCWVRGLIVAIVMLVLGFILGEIISLLPSHQVYLGSYFIPIKSLTF